MKWKLTTYQKDLLERVSATFLQGFLGSFVITEVSSKPMWLAAAGAGIAAVASLGKGLLARRVGRADSASLDRGV